MKLIAIALLKAQQEMGTAIKDSINPFFSSKYADLNSIREACMPALNKNGIVVLQPTVHLEGKNFIKTVLLHESGETFEGLTEIIYNKQNDAQAQGSGITYARRYGLQSLVNVGAEDDDGHKATQPAENTDNKPWLNEAQLKKIIARIENGEPELLETTTTSFKMKKEFREQLEQAVKSVTQPLNR